MDSNREVRREAHEPPPPDVNALVATLKACGVLADSRIEAAFRAVPRHVFLPELPLEQVYSDASAAIKYDNRGNVVAAVSEPSTVAVMLAQLDLQDGMNVLEIGTGTGYNAALMQQLVGSDGTVTTLELDKTLAEQAVRNLGRAGAFRVNVVNLDGAAGYSPRASYDRIIATVGLLDIPRQWVRQLKPGGVIVAPLWLNGHISVALRLQPDGTLLSRRNQPGSFVQIRGAYAAPDMREPIDGSGLVLAANDLNEIDAISLHLLLTHDLESAYLGNPLLRDELQLSFVPYLFLNPPEGYLFAHYFVKENMQAYGMITGTGFALITPGGACLVPYDGQGNAFTSGGADAFMAVHDRLDAWNTAGRPSITRMRIRLIPKTDGDPTLTRGRVYARSDHYLQVWLADSDDDSADHA